MKARRQKRIPPWTVIYIGMIAAVILAERDADVSTSLVSPVVAETIRPSLGLEAVTRRSDL